MAKEYKDLVVGLDIGTSKIMAVVAEVQADATLKVLGMGVAPSNGMKRGGSSTDDMTLALYRALDAHYARPGAGSGTAAVLAPVGAD